MSEMEGNVLKVSQNIYMAKKNIIKLDLQEFMFLLFNNSYI